VLNDAIPAMNDFANRWLIQFWNGPAQFRELGDGHGAIDEFVAKGTGCCGVIAGNVPHGALQIFKRLGRQDDRVSH
jgi:hypothetical protein